MATRKSAAKEQEFIKVDSFRVRRAVETNAKAIFFDLDLNGVTIYGCRVVSGRNGDFISFPSQQGKDEKWYSVAYAHLGAEDQDAIIQAVYDLLDAKK